MNSGSFKNDITNKLFTYKSYRYNAYVYKQDLTLNNPEGLIFHKTQPNQTNHLFFFAKLIRLISFYKLRKHWANNHCLSKVNKYIITYPYQLKFSSFVSILKMSDKSLYLCMVPTIK